MGCGGRGRGRGSRSGGGGSGGSGSAGACGGGSRWQPASAQHGEENAEQPPDAGAPVQRLPDPGPSYFVRPLAAQWRFVCRALQRFAPEERVHDMRRQVVLGDHVLVRNSWDFTEQHGIICSALGEDGHARRNMREESHWVVHWLEEEQATGRGRLNCTPLSQFSKACELWRVSYPHWACQCYVPAASTILPYVRDERKLESDNPEIVARQANSLQRSGEWRPTWPRSPCLEFCIHVKTGGRQPPFEVNDRRTLSSEALPHLGVLIKGDRSPSELFSARARQSQAVVAQQPSQVLLPPPAAPPGYAPRQMVNEIAGYGLQDAGWQMQAWGGFDDQRMGLHSMAQAVMQQPMQQPIPQPMQQPMQPMQPMQQPIQHQQAIQQRMHAQKMQGLPLQGMSAMATPAQPMATPMSLAAALPQPAAAASTLSADAEVFVPRSWDGIFQ